MFKHCPGIKSLIYPKIIIRECPFCGEEVEFLEYEKHQKCPRCGRIVYREASEACVAWCPYALKCINDLESKGLISKSRAKELRSIIRR